MKVAVPPEDTVHLVGCLSCCLQVIDASSRGADYVLGKMFIGMAISTNGGAWAGV